jgi:hypothetical protein
MTHGEEHEKKAYHIMVDHKPHQWPEPFITGAQIRDLAKVDASYGVWMELPGPTDDPPIPDNQSVDLRSPGVEKFFTGKKTTTEGRE